MVWDGMMIRKIIYFFAGCIILLAMLVVGSRLLIPLLDKHHAEIEAKASVLLQMPVTIKQVRLSWYQYQPEISLNDVTMFNKDTKAPILQVEKIRVFVSIPQSLWQWKLVPSGIMISGADINIYEKTTGEIALQGFPSLGGFNNQPFKSESKFIDVMSWLTQQPRLILNNVDLRYTGFDGSKRFLTLYNLSFENADNKHIIFGRALLHQEMPTEVAATLQWRGNRVELNKINVHGYLFVSNLSLSQWWKGYIWNGWQINAGTTNAKIWVHWNKGVFQKIQCVFEAYGLDLYSTADKSSHKVNRLSGNMGWRHEGQSQVFAGDEIFIDLPSHLWPSTSFYITLAPDVAGALLPTAVNVGYVDLTDVQNFLLSSPSLVPASLHHLSTELQLQGNIQSASIIFSGAPMDWKSFSLNGNVSQVGVQPWHQFPGIKNLTGIIQWNGKKGELSLHSNQAIVQYDTIFSHPITIDQLSGKVLWQLDPNNNWVIGLQALQALNPDAAINVNGTLTVPTSGSIISDLSANFTIQQAKHVSQYLPMRTFGPELVTWLQAAFLSGVIESGNAILRGPLDDFPFENANSETKEQFQMAATLKNMNFHYAPNWPLLKNIQGKIIFSGRQMLVNLDHAEVQGISIEKVRGMIPYLGDKKPAILQVDTEAIPLDFTRGLDFIHASPLEKTIGKIFADTKIEGPTVLTLSLTVPLNNTDNTAVNGNLVFKETNLNLVPWNLVISHLQGQLHFTEATTEAEGIEGMLFNKPLQLTLQTLPKSKGKSAVIRAIIANNLAVTDIESWLKIPLSQVVTGAAAVAANIDFATNAPMEIHLQSNLVGMEVNLPEEYAKKSQESRDFSADITLQEQQPLRVKLSYGDLLGAALILQNKNEKFDLISADLHLGKGSPAWPASSGLFITGNLEELDWNKIRAHMNQSQSSTFSGLTLRDIDMNIKKLSLPGQQLTQVHLEVKPNDNYWDINVASNEIDGHLLVPVKLTPQSLITLQFKNLDLTSTASKQNIEKIEIKSLPAISFTANSVSYNKMQLGQVSFKTNSTANGLTIQSLTVSSPFVDLRAEGNWTSSGTQLKGMATSEDVSRLLASLQFDAHNLVAKKGRFDFDLTWRATPYAISLASMNGQASLNLDQGRIVELSQTSGAKMDLGRMLNIFSLQTIPRRLSFDFSDVTQKGYSFDSFRGDVRFEKGNAYTNNTRFDGPVARVTINGRIGLTQKDYDLTLSVTPYVTSSIPIAATLLTGQPVIGIAVWAVDKVISSSVSNVTTHYYAVSGPWSNPAWQAVGTPKKE
jgi:uncharacterized protein (TIGR02099 family)